MNLLIGIIVRRGIGGFLRRGLMGFCRVGYLSLCIGFLRELLINLMFFLGPEQVVNDVNGAKTIPKGGYDVGDGYYDITDDKVLFNSFS